LCIGSSRMYIYPRTLAFFATARKTRLINSKKESFAQ
jgi:hypothetical protein